MKTHSGGGKSGKRHRCPNLFTDTATLFPDSKVNDKSTPKDTNFTMMLTTRAMIKKGEICGRVIQSSSNTFYAKGRCTITSHAKKHALFGPNRVFLASSSGASTSTTQKVIKTENFHLEIENPRDSRVLSIIQGGIKALKGIKI